MATYENKLAQARISKAEFRAGPNGQIGVYHFTSKEAENEVKPWLQTMGQGVLGETQLDGHPVLITQSDDLGAEQGVQALAARGEALQLKPKQQGVDPWVVRSLLGFGGQALQLTSSFMRPSRKLDWSTFVFSAANLTANGINLAYRAQNLDDTHQLLYLKTKINESLAPELKPGEQPPAPEDKRLPYRLSEQEKRRHVDPINDFMKRNSVNVGELGLRYIGAFGMAFPATGWGALAKGKIPAMTAAPLRRAAGLGSIAGKTVALTSKVEDPYNPKPVSAFEHWREKFAFLTGGLIEAGAFSALAYDSFFKTGVNGPKGSGIAWKGKVYRDWLGGIGAAMFVTGYIVRSWAKYGERKVNMGELYAHVSDTLAKAPPEKIPELLSKTTAEITAHFGGKQNVDFSTVYMRIANDLHLQHHIDVMPPSTVQPHVIAAAQSPVHQVAAPAQADGVLVQPTQAISAAI